MTALAAMRPLLSAEGDAALAALVRAGTPLLAFDFDGTLAPIVAHPDDARLDEAVAGRLARLAAHWPVAIVTGRAVADVRARLGAFVPRYVVGNHGAEDTAAAGAPDPRRWVKALDPLRAAMHSHRALIEAAGVGIEDKALSIAFHYRQAAEPARARAAIRAVLAAAMRAAPSMRLHTFDGKRVVNAVAAGAPDKAHAVQRLVAASGAHGALFAGDDINDEPVFAAAPEGWVTVRIGAGGADPDDAYAPSLARWTLDGPQQIAPLLDRLIALAGAA
jgi:trehalose 6-phosphate phosphatase